MLKNYLIGFILILTYSCSSPSEPEKRTATIIKDTTTYTPYSNLENTYLNFNSPTAANCIADMENLYFRNYTTGITPYYGTEWRKSAESSMASSDSTEFQEYLNKLGAKADSMHCTIYAVKALQSGLDSLWDELQAKHTLIYKEHEHAGWSIAHILVEHFDWEAYLFIEEYSEEFKHCNATYKRSQSYPVWNQPDISLSGMYVKGKQDSLINDLLNQHEFGWGFSKQGWHTWITRFDQLKECIWYGAPGLSYEKMGLPLFRTTPFLDYYDYASHVIVFPPKSNY